MLRRRSHFSKGVGTGFHQIKFANSLALYASGVQHWWCSIGDGISEILIGNEACHPTSHIERITWQPGQASRVVRRVGGALGEPLTS